MKKKFDAKFRVELEIKLALYDNQLQKRSIWSGPDATFFTIEPGGVYFVQGLNLDAEGHPQDPEYWSDSGADLPCLDAADLRALQEWGRITLLEGSFSSDDPNQD